MREWNTIMRDWFNVKICVCVCVCVRVFGFEYILAPTRVRCAWSRTAWCTSYMQSVRLEPTNGDARNIEPKVYPCGIWSIYIYTDIRTLLDYLQANAMFQSNANTKGVGGWVVWGWWCIQDNKHKTRGFMLLITHNYWKIWKQNHLIKSLNYCSQ